MFTNWQFSAVGVFDSNIITFYLIYKLFTVQFEMVCDNGTWDEIYRYKEHMST